MSTYQSRTGHRRSAHTRLSAAVAGVATAAVVATASLAGSVVTAGPASAGQSCGRADFATSRGSGFYGAISWMACEKISVGYEDNTFRKNKAVTRGEVAAFLYRQVQPSHPKSDERYFTDVNPGGANYQAITWFAQDGISVGYRDRTFRPNQPVTRGELAGFLHRLADKPATSGAAFADMGPGAAFSPAAAWLRDRGSPPATRTAISGPAMTSPVPRPRRSCTRPPVSSRAAAMSPPPPCNPWTRPGRRPRWRPGR